MPILLLLISLAFAAEKYGVYDLQGNRISTFEAEWFDLPEKTQQVKQKNPYKRLYVSSLKKGKAVKPASRYRYKAETGAYIEASRKETFSVCPDKEIQGTWISEHSVYLNEANCLSVQVPSLAGTFRILFLQNSGRTDTIQVLVEQSYIQMGDYSHKIYVPDTNKIKSMINSSPIAWRFDILPGNYESRSYNRPLIVDKTKFTMGDAHYYYKIGNVVEKRTYNSLVYPEKIEDSKLPQPESHLAWKFANERSKREGLDTAYRVVDIRSYKNKDTGNLIFLGNPYAIDASHAFLAVDTLASGYRLPFDDEWSFLMRAGASTRYYWGDQEDSLTVSRYAWVRPVGLKPVAQLLPNRFGLYDMLGIAGERVMARKTDTAYSGMRYEYYDTGFSGCNKCPEGVFMEKIMTVMLTMRMPSESQTCTLKKKEPGKEDADWICKDIEQKPKLVTEKAGFGSLRLLRKTPKLHKLEKF